MSGYISVQHVVHVGIEEGTLTYNMAPVGAEQLTCKEHIR